MEALRALLLLRAALLVAPVGGASADPQACADRDDRWAEHNTTCARMSRLCDNADYGTLVRSWCPVSCGVCVPGVDAEAAARGLNDTLANFSFQGADLNTTGRSSTGRMFDSFAKSPKRRAQRRPNGTRGGDPDDDAPQPLNATTTTSTCPARTFEALASVVETNASEVKRRPLRQNASSLSVNGETLQAALLPALPAQDRSRRMVGRFDAWSPEALAPRPGSANASSNATAAAAAGSVVLVGPSEANEVGTKASSDPWANITLDDRLKDVSLELPLPYRTLSEGPNLTSGKASAGAFFIRHEPPADLILDVEDTTGHEEDWASAAAELARWAPPAPEPPPAEPVLVMRGERFFPAACAMRAEGAAADLPLKGSPYTLEAWIMPDEDIGHGGIVGWGDWGTHGAVQALRFSGGSRLKNYWWGNALVAETSESLADGEYHHIAATFDGSVRKIFVDFKEVARQVTSGYNAVSKANFCIGQTNGNENFRGRIKDLKIWKVALSAVDMASPGSGRGRAFEGSSSMLSTDLLAANPADPSLTEDEKSRRCPPGFERVVGDVYGGDQFSGGYSSTAASMADCARKCAFTAGCGSFEFSPSKKRCFRNSQTRPTHDEDRQDFVFCRRAPCPSLKTEQACVGPDVPAAKHSVEVNMRPGSYCIWSGGHCRAPMACTEQDCFLPDGGLPGMELPKRYTLWISRAGLQATMLNGR